MIDASKWASINGGYFFKKANLGTVWHCCISISYFYLKNLFLKYIYFLGVFSSANSKKLYFQSIMLLLFMFKKKIKTITQGKKMPNSPLIFFIFIFFCNHFSKMRSSDHILDDPDPIINLEMDPYKLRQIIKQDFHMQAAIWVPPQ